MAFRGRLFGAIPSRMSPLAAAGDAPFPAVTPLFGAARVPADPRASEARIAGKIPPEAPTSQTAAQAGAASEADRVAEAGGEGAAGPPTRPRETSLSASQRAPAISPAIFSVDLVAAAVLADMTSGARAPSPPETGVAPLGGARALQRDLSFRYLIDQFSEWTDSSDIGQAETERSPAATPENADPQGGEPG